MACLANRERVSPLVLVVEDSPEVRELYTASLSDAGYQVLEAQNGFEALKKAGDLLPDLVITDLRVPGLDGFELCRALRANPQTRHIPVIATTASPIVNVRRRAQAAGCETILDKCTNLEILLRQMTRLLTRGKRGQDRSLWPDGSTALRRCHRILTSCLWQFQEPWPARTWPSPCSLMVNVPEMATILVVEDDPAIRDLLVVALGWEGHHVLTAANGADALQQLHDGTPVDLILLDLYMPHLDGWGSDRNRCSTTPGRPSR